MGFERPPCPHCGSNRRNFSIHLAPATLSIEGSPGSGDRRRDVIATRPGVGSVRIIGQVKAYNEGHVVTAEEVAAIAFTRDLDRASKAMLMTSRFAPGILKDERLKSHMPHQLELMDGSALLRWLRELRRSRKAGGHELTIGHIRRVWW